MGASSGREDRSDRKPQAMDVSSDGEDRSDRKPQAVDVSSDGEDRSVREPHSTSDYNSVRGGGRILLCFSYGTISS